MLVANATAFFQQRLKNERNEDANAAIVEIDTDANNPSYPNQLALFEIYPPKKL